MHIPFDSVSAGNTGGSDQRYISKVEIQNIVTQELKGRMSENFRLHIGDESYYMPSLEDAMRLVEESRVCEYTWCDEAFDCDDFAVMLKAHFCRDAYRNNVRRHAHCFGIVWGMIPRSHACNWMINADMKLRFVDPMFNEIYEPVEKARYVWMMIV